MSLYRVTTGLAALTGIVVILFGVNFLLNPQGAAAGFGIDPWPVGNAAGYFVVKGVRDLATGTTVLILLASGHRRVLGWIVLVNAVIPLGDAVAVYTNGGSLAEALGIHVSAAAVVLLTAFLLLREAAQRKPLDRGAANAAAGGTKQ